MHQMISEQQAREKIRGYLKIMVWLTVLTVIEVAVPEVVGNKILLAILLTVMACWKAGIVGWHYMHLNHETGWMRFVALTPLIAAIYAGVLMLEAPTRAINEYREGRLRESAVHGTSDAFDRIYRPFSDTVEVERARNEKASEAAPVETAPVDAPQENQSE